MLLVQATDNKIHVRPSAAPMRYSPTPGNVIAQNRKVARHGR